MSTSNLEYLKKLLISECRKVSMEERSPEDYHKCFNKLDFLYKKPFDLLDKKMTHYEFLDWELKYIAENLGRQENRNESVYLPDSVDDQKAVKDMAFIDFTLHTAINDFEVMTIDLTKTLVFVGTRLCQQNLFPRKYFNQSGTRKTKPFTPTGYIDCLIKSIDEFTKAEIKKILDENLPISERLPNYSISQLYGVKENFLDISQKSNKFSEDTLAHRHLIEKSVKNHLFENPGKSAGFGRNGLISTLIGLRTQFRRRKHIAITLWEMKSKTKHHLKSKERLRFINNLMQQPL